MKVKISFNPDGIKRFFMGNGEKLVFAATVVIFLLFLYSTITAKPLDDTKSPEAIKRESSQVVSTIQSPTWSEHRNEMGLLQTHFKEQVGESMRPISGLRVAIAHEWDPPLFPELIKRGDPDIYPVEDLQIAAGSGLVPYKTEAAATTAGPGTPGVAAGPRSGLAPILPGGPGLPPRGPGLAGEGSVSFGGAYPGSIAGAQARMGQDSNVPGVHAPGADAEPKSYVIITGAVPVEKEVEEYRRRFESAVAPVLDLNRPPLVNVTDLPHYFCFLIDRAEVKDANDANRNWTPILSKVNIVNAEVMKDLTKWFTQAPDIVHPDDVFQPEPFKEQYFYVTWPLPPLFLKNWGYEAAHPKVKLNLAPEAAQESQPDTTQNGGNLDAITPERGAGMNDRFNPGAGVPPAFRGPPGGPPVGPGMHGGFGPREVPGMTMGMASQADVPVDPYKLFRFVDLTAEPGKTYRYRVQLLLYNPNYGIREECLDPKTIQAGSAGKKFTDWSPWAETPAITVPQQFHILADYVTVGRQSEVKANINLLAFAKTPAAESQTGATPANPDTWVEVVKPVDVLLGGLVFCPEQEIDKVLDMSAETVRKVEKISIDTNQTMLLDVRNDKPLGDGKSKDATELLLMDAAGRVYDASHAADKLVLDDYQERSKPPADLTQSSGTETPVTPRPGERRTPGGPRPGIGTPGTGKGPTGPGLPGHK